MITGSQGRKCEKSHLIESGTICYRVNWRKGYPWIEPGSIVIVGNVKKRNMAEFPDGKVDLTKVFRTIKGAIEDEILLNASLFGRKMWPGKVRPGEPWDMLCVMAELSRLARKLKKHNLLK